MVIALQHLAHKINFGKPKIANYEAIQRFDILTFELQSVTDDGCTLYEVKLVLLAFTGKNELKY